MSLGHGNPPLYLLELYQKPIFHQLQLEEALLRADKHCYGILNTGSSPAIVLGISGKPDELVHHEQAEKQKLPLIRRFSGGGCVVVDPATIFVTMIGDNRLLAEAYPEQVLRYFHQLIKPAFAPYNLELIDNDFTLGTKKVGGNALYIQKDRWLIHTSFLWDYQLENMTCLTMPKKVPAYRNKRSHETFVTKLKLFFPSKEHLMLQIKQALGSQFSMQPIGDEQCAAALSRPHRKATCWIQKSPT